LSTWPSWSEKLAKDLGATMPADPVNRMGPCPANYNKKTCWDEQAKTFAGTVPTGSGANGLPAGSLVYTYNATGSGVGVCATTESGYLPTLYCLSF
jgi:hypothetical protein